MIQCVKQCILIINRYYRRLSTIIEDYQCTYTLQMSFTHTITYLQYCLKIKTNGFQSFFGGNGNRTFFVFGGNG
jgi:hypothetical protein